MPVPVLGAKGKIRRWWVSFILECQCDAKELLVLNDAAVQCPSCGMLHQFASFNVQGQPLIPAEMGLNIASWLPRTVSDA